MDVRVAAMGSDSGNLHCNCCTGGSHDCYVMTEEMAQLRQLLVEAETCLKHGHRRQGIKVLRRLAAVATTLALTLELQRLR